MACTVQRYKALISLAMNMVDGTAELTITHMVMVILVLCNFSHVLAYLTLAMWVSLVVPWRLICTT